MACVDTLPRTTTDTSAGFERVRYFPRQLLTADDMRIEQEYFRDKQRRHNRFLHGWGVVCGLEVKLDPETGPLAVRICPGYALGPCGDEIYVPDSVPFDLGECTRRPADPCGGGTAKGTAGVSAAAVGAFGGPALAALSAAVPTSIVVSIRYVEYPTRPLRTLPAGCGCDDTACEYSRIRDGFDIRCRPQEKAKAATPPLSLCEVENSKGKKLPAWTEVPDDPWVDLATITLVTDKKSMALDAAAIDNGIRRLVFSTTMIQQQVITCCCHPKK
jgi:hypothetical protein